MFGGCVPRPTQMCQRRTKSALGVPQRALGIPGRRPQICNSSGMWDVGVDFWACGELAYVCNHLWGGITV